MKLFLLLLLTLFSINTFAQTEEGSYDLLQKNYQQQLDLIKVQDKLLQSLLNIPFEKRVYVYPALFESHHIPKKIVTHPQILIWKGKKPTMIAPQMQEFAQEYLDTMPAKFYPLLDPDVWPKQPKSEDWHTISNLLQGTIADPNKTPKTAILQEIK